MSQTVTAIYSNGVLRPLVSLDLPENSEVELDLKVIEKPKNKIKELLVNKGLNVENTRTKVSNKLSAEERQRLAKLFSAPQELGELINEDREER
jgi:predicted DNA-binding antitoxin AbrB/MazE fold protein